MCKICKPSHRHLYTCTGTGTLSGYCKRRNRSCSYLKLFWYILTVKRSTAVSLNHSERNSSSSSILYEWHFWFQLNKETCTRTTITVHHKAHYPCHSIFYSYLHVYARIELSPFLDTDRLSFIFIKTETSIVFTWENIFRSFDRLVWILIFAVSRGRGSFFLSFLASFIEEQDLGVFSGSGKHSPPCSHKISESDLKYRRACCSVEEERRFPLPSYYH